MAKGIIVDDATNAIVRQVSGDPLMMALQAGVGESLFVIEEEGIGLLQDGKLFVDEAGDVCVQPGQVLASDLPTITLHYVPT